MMRWLDRLRRDRSLRDTIQLLAPLVMAAIAGLWAVYTNFAHHSNKSKGDTSGIRNSIAEQGSVAVGGDINGSTINVDVSASRAANGSKR